MRRVLEKQVSYASVAKELEDLLATAPKGKSDSQEVRQWEIKHYLELKSLTQLLQGIEWMSLARMCLPAPMGIVRKPSKNV